MITVNNILLLSICLFFPLSLYENYLTYIKTLELKEKSIFLEFTLFISLLLLFRFFQDFSYMTIFYSIPLILALKRKDYLTALTISILIIIMTKSNPLILVLKYLLYFIFAKYLKKEKYFFIVSIFLELLYLLLLPKLSLLTIFIILILFIIFTYLEVAFFIQGTKITDLNTIIRELNREKALRSSISKLTHELKNPIAVCNGYLEMLDLNNIPKATKYISIIQSEITRSKTIIDEFSTYGKLKKLEYEELDITYLFEDIKLLLEPLFKLNKAKLSIDSKEEIYIYGDYNKLKQVFINLLKNTIEAKQPKISLKVSISITQKKSQVIIIVQDNGIGMSEETLHHVSELFFTTKPNGTGLGLAFSKEVIELHGGIFKITSLEKIGTTITITLPKEKKSEDFNNKNY